MRGGIWYVISMKGAYVHTMPVSEYFHIMVIVICLKRFFKAADFSQASWMEQEQLRIKWIDPMGVKGMDLVGIHFLSQSFQAFKTTNLCV